MRFNGARFGGLLNASLLTSVLMTLLISLLSLPVSPLWPVLLGVLAAATVCLTEGTRLSWLPDAAWMAGCLLTVLAVPGAVTDGLAELLGAGVRTWERLRGWDAEAIPCGPFCGVVTGEQREIQRPWVFGGVFAPFCRRGQKDVAPEREISLPEA